jgi:hypothetical protein
VVQGADTTAFGTGAYALDLNLCSGATPSATPPATQAANGSPLTGGGGVPMDPSLVSSVLSFLTGTIGNVLGGVTSVFMETSDTYDVASQGSAQGHPNWSAPDDPLGGVAAWLDRHADAIGVVPPSPHALPSALGDDVMNALHAANPGDRHADAIRNVALILSNQLGHDHQPVGDLGADSFDGDAA